MPALPIPGVPPGPAPKSAVAGGPSNIVVPDYSDYEGEKVSRLIKTRSDLVDIDLPAALIRYEFLVLASSKTLLLTSVSTNAELKSGDGVTLLLSLLTRMASMKLFHDVEAD